MIASSSEGGEPNLQLTVTSTAFEVFLQPVALIVTVHLYEPLCVAEKVEFVAPLIETPSFFHLYFTPLLGSETAVKTTAPFVHGAAETVTVGFGFPVTEIALDVAELPQLLVT